MPHTDQRIRTRNEVALNGRIYKTVGPPQRRLVSVFPGKVTTGDYTQESNPIASTKVWESNIFGIGRENSDDRSERAREQAWFSTLSLRHRKHLVLQRQGFETAANAAIGTDESVQWLAELSEEVYAIANLDIYKYDDTTDSWGSSLRTFAAAPTDVITAPVNGTETLIVAQSGQGVDYSTDGSTWTNESGGTNIKLVSWGFRDLLWGIDSSGTTYFTANLANGWTQVATLRAIKGEPTQLFLGPNPANPTEDILYCATQKTLYVYDNQNERWYQTGLGDLPFHENGGAASTTWRGYIYYNAGLNIYQVDPTGQVPVLEIGPTNDDGLPSEYQGSISAMQGTFRELIIVIDGAASADTSDIFDSGAFTDGLHPDNILSGGSGRSTLLGWSPITRGWEVKWRDSLAGTITSENILISNSYNAYRMYWSAGETVYFQSLPVGIDNPNQIPDAQRQPTGFWWGPHFDADVTHQDKTALEIHVETSGCDTANTATISYVLNGDDADSAIKSFPAITSNGEHEFLLPNETEPEGVPFLTFQPRVDLARGNTTTDTPDVKKIALIYKKTMETLWGWDFVIEMNKSTRRYSPEEMRDELFGSAGAIEQRTLLPFTYKDELDNDQNYWVVFITAFAEEHTGHDDKALWRVTVAEPV